MIISLIFIFEQKGTHKTVDGILYILNADEVFLNPKNQSLERLVKTTIFASQPVVAFLQILSTLSIPDFFKRKYGHSRYNFITALHSVRRP